MKFLETQLPWCFPIAMWPNRAQANFQLPSSTFTSASRALKLSPYVVMETTKPVLDASGLVKSDDLLTTLEPQTCYLRSQKMSFCRPATNLIFPAAVKRCVSLSHMQPTMPDACCAAWLNISCRCQQMSHQTLRLIMLSRIANTSCCVTTDWSRRSRSHWCRT